MAHIRREIEISAHLARVWEVIADLESVANWNPNVSSATSDGGPLGLGTARTCHLAQGGHIDEVVSEWDAGRSVQFAIGRHGGIRSADMGMTVSASAAGTRVTAIADYHLAFGPLGPVIDRVSVKGQMARMLDEALAGLKEYLEDRPSYQTQRKGLS
jgi:carbon monoxide dehydrogenase subunit G